MGIAKRQRTKAAKKQERVLAKKEKLKELYGSFEAEFQAERARRIERLFGRPFGTGESFGVQPTHTQTSGDQTDQ